MKIQVFAFLFFLPLMTAAYDQAFPKTEVGAFEIKTVACEPAGHISQNSGFQ